MQKMIFRFSVIGNYSLRINLEDFGGNQRYAEYKNFQVADEKVMLSVYIRSGAGDPGPKMPQSCLF